MKKNNKRAPTIRKKDDSPQTNYFGCIFIILLVNVGAYLALGILDKEDRLRTLKQTKCPVIRCRSRVLHKTSWNNFQELNPGDCQLLVNFNINGKNIMELFPCENCTKTIDCWYYKHGNNFNYGIGQPKLHDRKWDEVFYLLFTSTSITIILAILVITKIIYV